MAFLRKLAASALASIGLLATGPALGDEGDPPKLIVAIVVDQFSAAEFAQYREHYTGGLKRLTEGAVFPSGYHGHSATETCPGHAAIMTGANPARSGIVGNYWIDQGIARADKEVYCAEDESAPGTDHSRYVESSQHLLVPTLGERIHGVEPASRNVAVSGKDRAALMMGGKAIDAAYFWKKGQFVTLPGKPVDPVVAEVNARLALEFAAPTEDVAVPEWCRDLERAIPVNDVLSVGTGHFARPGGNDENFKTSPAFDRWTIEVAEKLVDTMRLGQGAATDVLSLSLSANDYIGHAYGTQGVEMCIQQEALDRSLAGMFDFLDARSIDYAVVLTADHGGQDLPERIVMQGDPTASRRDPGLSARDAGSAVAAELGLDATLPAPLLGGPTGDYYVNRALPADVQAKVKAAAIAKFRASSQVAAVFDAAELAARPVPTGPVDEWTLEDRARASYYAPHSGDFVVLLKSSVSSIARPVKASVATHGSPWDVDRRVPILFWRKGMSGFEQPLAVRTVDIVPTLAALAEVAIPAGEIDGRCLDLDAGPGTTCDP
ncbi:alkaline phosphatase family protein [Altererythrobacter salegens]|uniref:Alkaline phosphatase family protein n=1 Tax=Croceibacterium salegens TaxID=1737568 RepID=A0A6I4ST24_9SPHN|nr:alkaline phosphatase family protein [Croceibacterium salegens]MXO59161.1 alkaline phosphatase family protein [Croceibacterium salegens]